MGERRTHKGTRSRQRTVGLTLQGAQWHSWTVKNELCWDRLAWVCAHREGAMLGGVGAMSQEPALAAGTELGSDTLRESQRQTDAQQPSDAAAAVSLKQSHR